MDAPTPKDNKKEDLPIDDHEIITLRTYDNVELKLTVGAARYSNTIRQMIVDAGRTAVSVTLPLSSEFAVAIALQKLFEFMEHYALNPLVEDPNTYSGEDRDVTNTKLSDFDKTWLAYDTVWTKENYDFWETALEACDYLDITEIVNVVCQAMSDKLTDKTEAEIVVLFDIKKEDMPTPEERAEIEKNYAFLKEE